MDLIQGYSSDTSEENNENNQIIREFSVKVGGNDLEEKLTAHELLKDIDLVRHKRDIKKKFVTAKEHENVERFSFKISRRDLDEDILATRNRFSDTFVLTEEGVEKNEFIKSGLDKDVVAVSWTLYCPGKGSCRRACGGIGACAEGIALIIV